MIDYIQTQAATWGWQRGDALNIFVPEPTPASVLQQSKAQEPITRRIMENSKWRRELQLAKQIIRVDRFDRHFFSSFSFDADVIENRFCRGKDYSKNKTTCKNAVA